MCYERGRAEAMVRGRSKPGMSEPGRRLVWQDREDVGRGAGLGNGAGKRMRPDQTLKAKVRVWL